MPMPAHRPITRFGLQINSFTFPGVPEGDRFERIAQIAGTAERSGFDSIWVMDHFYQISVNGARTEPMFEAYSLLAAIAARTDRAQLGAMVTGVTYRNPAMLAKMVTTLDVISGGRAILGIGAAWNEDEHRGAARAGARADRRRRTRRVGRRAPGHGVRGIAELRTRYGARLHTDPAPQTIFVFLNVLTPPFDDRNVRRALNYAVDRGRVAELLGGPETQHQTCQLLPPGFPDIRPRVPTSTPTARASGPARTWRGHAGWSPPRGRAA